MLVQKGQRGGRDRGKKTPGICLRERPLPPIIARAFQVNGDVAFTATKCSADTVPLLSADRTALIDFGSQQAHLQQGRRQIAKGQRATARRASDDVGRAITREQEALLLAACQSSRSRSLHIAVLLALNTCMRYSELRLLKWERVNFVARTVTVGTSKTESGAGRMIPLNPRALSILRFWAALFPNREPEHYVFPSEKYGLAQRKDEPKGSTRVCVHSSDATKPIGRWKEAWEGAKAQAGVQCRFHDLRHTGCTRMLEAGVPFSVVASIMGWSASTTVRMAKRYGHIGVRAQRLAVEALCEPVSDAAGAQNRAQSKR